MHVRDYDLQSAPDRRILALAREEGRVLISADTDFGTVLALADAPGPSVVLFRRPAGRRAAQQLKLVVAVLPEVEEAPASGAVVVLEADRVRVRTLPITGSCHPVGRVPQGLAAG